MLGFSPFLSILESNVLVVISYGARWQEDLRTWIFWWYGLSGSFLDVWGLLIISRQRIYHTFALLLCSIELWHYRRTGLGVSTFSSFLCTIRDKSPYRVGSLMSFWFILVVIIFDYVNLFFSFFSPLINFFAVLCIWAFLH